MTRHCLSDVPRRAFPTKRNPLKKSSWFSFLPCASHWSYCPRFDVRFGWSNLPWYICAFGDALVVVSFYLFYLVSKVNTYAAANIRVEEEQKVISTGLYGFVRHPMYFASLFLFIGTPLALGSWWTLLLIPISLLILVARILNEEKVLMRDLPGYLEYQNRVTTRLIPFVW